MNRKERRKSFHLMPRFKKKIELENLLSIGQRQFWTAQE